ncbi:MAG: VWA domain-containing protein [Deltaproteobacteria bacterium]|nr:VWA domain-containing protein [Deltaproteobacteria bacterium]
MNSFAWPWMFLCLPLPLLGYFLLSPVRAAAGPALRVPFYRQLADFYQAGGGRAPLWLRLLAVLIWVLLVGAAARPQWLGDPRRTPISGRDLMLAVDISGSMRTEDMVLNDRPVDRLTMIKKIAGEFIDRRRGDRLGLILFGTRAYLQAPLSFDRRTVKQLLQESLIGMAGKKTAIGDAIGLAVKRLRERPGKRKVMILLTDGDNTAGTIDPLRAARMAAAAQVSIYTVGIGADRLQVNGFFGRRVVNPTADLDERMLREIAGSTNGRYFRARDSRELAKIYALLDQLEPVAGDDRHLRPVRELFYWPLGAALLFSFLLLAVRNHEFS